VLDDGAELLIDAGIPNRADRFMRTMQKTAPPDTLVTSQYAGRRRVLVLYGPGGPTKLPLIAKHRQAGGRVAMFDLGYWNRHDGMRLSIDTLHPTPELLAMAPDGPGRREFVLREDAKADGPIMLVGLGPKSVWAYGINGVQHWERQQLAELRQYGLVKTRRQSRSIFYSIADERAQAVMGMLYEIFCGDAKAVGARVAAPAPRPSTPARGDTAQFARITAVARR
jgi:hypothetical protein